LLTSEFSWSKQAHIIYGVKDDFKPDLKSFLNLYAGVDRDLFLKHVKNAIDQKIPFDIELNYQSEGGSEIWHMERGVPVIKDGAVVLLRGTVMDITTSKIAEHQLRSAKKYLEQSNLDKDRIMQVLVHDLRSPLSGIHSVSSMMLKKNSYTVSDREMLSVINDTSLFLFKMVNDLVGITLNNENRMLKKEETDLQLLVQQAIQVLRFKASEKMQTIEFSIDNQIFAFIDSQKIQRVLNNLINNSIKFSPAGSVITVVVKDEGSLLLMSVTDKGVGIPHELKHKVFDVFTEAKRYGTNNEQPFGLGLSICKQIIDAHDGKIWLETEVGKGTVFFIEIPDSVVRVINR
jgi:signal transduction histidine kinase